MSKKIEDALSCVEENKSQQSPPAAKLEMKEPKKHVECLPSDEGDLRKKMKDEPESSNASFERP